MTEKVISVGDEIDSYCRTCKLVLAHQVVALVDGKVEKVICKTCGKRHKYRPNPPKSRARKTGTASKKETTTTRKKTTRTRKTKDPAARWEEVLAEKNVSHAKMYSMDGLFDQDDVIKHKKFGYGLVTEIRAERKMEVLFKEGTKLLVWGRKGLMRDT
jgi:uncharacterized Zn finger protein (UPF0148 family)